jgi:hypothetical protein
MGYVNVARRLGVKLLRGTVTAIETRGKISAV